MVSQSGSRQQVFRSDQSRLVTDVSVNPADGSWLGHHNLHTSVGKEGRNCSSGSVVYHRFSTRIPLEGGKLYIL